MTRAETPPSHPHVDAALAYCRGVVSGEIVACRLTRLACQRHLDDLDRAAGDDFPYLFDPEQAERVCRFMELCHHVKGRWAQRGERLVLQPWQSFITAAIFGWLEVGSGLRRFRRVYLEIPRKMGKSFWAALLGKYMFAADGEHAAEVYCGAMTEKQAHHVFGQAWGSARANREFRDYFGVEISGTIKNPRALYRASDRSVFQPVIGKPGDGASPSCAIVDEYHEAESPDLVEAMKTGMGARSQPLLLMITTAGSDTSGPCYLQRQESVGVLEGVANEDQLFTCIWTIDEGDDWKSETALRKANPNLGVSVGEEFLRSEQQQAINSAWKQAAFKTKHLNVWITARSPWINSEHWHACALDDPIDPAAYREMLHYVGLDLSSKRDITARQSVLVDPEAAGYLTTGRYYLPEDRIHESQNAHAYRGWVEEGHLVATDGNQVDQERIFADLMDLHERAPITMLVADPWGFQWMGPRLEAAGITVMELPQTTKYVSDPMKHVEAMLPDRKIRHDGNPVLTWAMLNVVAKPDARDNLFPRKEQDDNKIDPARALLNAMYAALLGMGTESTVYTEDRGLVVL